MAVLQYTAVSGMEACRRLGTHPDRGLSAVEVEQRRRRWGDNRLAEAGRSSLLALLINQFRDFMVLVLLGATLLSGLLGEYSDAITILIIVVINAVLGLVQEYRAERSLEALKKITAPRAVVLRDGEIRVIPAAGVVPGDLLILEAGDRISADVRLLAVQGLAVNEAALTGESDTVLKSTAPLPGVVASPGDATNMAFSGTAVVAGRGRGVVVATGMQTQIGRIAHLIEQAEQAATPLQQRLEKLGKVLVAACFLVCCLVTGLGIVRGEPLYQMFMAGISLAVAAIPEGLPAIVTVSLALGVQRMIRRRAIVRRLPAVETLGSASVICADKTGTLTENRMSVHQFYGDGRLFKFEGKVIREKEAGGWVEVTPAGKKVLALALSIAARCNNACREGGGFRGDPTEVALLEAAQSAGFREQKFERLREFPFSSERKMMSVIAGREERRLLLKGAPEIVLDRCRFVRSGTKVAEMTPARRREIVQEIDRMAALALRGLAVAYRDLSAYRGPLEARALERDLVWVGLFGLADPPRPEALPAVRRCHRAGVRVVMITGDHRTTAEAVARRLDILEKGGLVLTGQELEALDDRQLQKEIHRVRVFARVNPAHKLRLVRAYKNAGYVVAMTGDGINDAPAVKEADIGIAMGRTGTDVTREAADLVLNDDNFSTIVAAVEEGRNIYGNIRKFIGFLLGCNTGEVLTMLLAILAGLPLPLRPIQILWINLVTDGLPALALGLDSPEPGLMNQPPQRKEESVFSGGLWGKLLARGFLIAVVTIIVFVYLLENTGDLLQAQTAAFATLIFTQLAYVFDCRSENRPFWTLRRQPNHFLTAAVFSSALLTILVIHHLFLNAVFYTVPLTVGKWLMVAVAGFVPSLIHGAALMLKDGSGRTAAIKSKIP